MIIFDITPRGTREPGVEIGVPYFDNYKPPKPCSSRVSGSFLVIIAPTGNQVLNKFLPDTQPKP